MHPEVWTTIVSGTSLARKQVKKCGSGRDKKNRSKKKKKKRSNKKKKKKKKKKKSKKKKKKKRSNKKKKKSKKKKKGKLTARISSSLFTSGSVAPGLGNQHPQVAGNVAELCRGRLVALLRVRSGKSTHH